MDVFKKVESRKGKKQKEIKKKALVFMRDKFFPSGGLVDFTKKATGEEFSPNGAEYVIFYDIDEFRPFRLVFRGNNAEVICWVEFDLETNAPKSIKLNHLEKFLDILSYLNYS